MGKTDVVNRKGVSSSPLTSKLNHPIKPKKWEAPNPPNIIIQGKQQSLSPSSLSPFQRIP